MFKGVYLNMCIQSYTRPSIYMNLNWNFCINRNEILWNVFKNKTFGFYYPILTVKGMSYACHN